jgi:hypothetical protein
MLSFEFRHNVIVLLSSTIACRDLRSTVAETITVATDAEKKETTKRTVNSSSSNPKIETLN